MEKIVAAIDGLNERIGRAASWLTLFTVLCCFAVVVLRYAFDWGRIWMQEMYVWAHAAVFLLGAGYTYLRNGHVRVDLFYGRMTARGRAWVELCGVVFVLVPWLAIVLFYGWSFIANSWRIFEASNQAGGLPGMFLLKSLIGVFCVLLALQGVAMACRSILVLRGREEFAPQAGTH